MCMDYIYIYIYHMQLDKLSYLYVVYHMQDQITGGSVPVKCIYYLEKGSMNGVYYVLGYSAPGMHATVQLYQGAKPSFFELEERMIQAVSEQSAPMASSHFGK